jgi:hypothetical protein
LKPILQHLFFVVIWRDVWCQESQHDEKNDNDQACQRKPISPKRSPCLTPGARSIHSHRVNALSGIGRQFGHTGSPLLNLNKVER